MDTPPGIAGKMTSPPKKNRIKTIVSEPVSILSPTQIFMLAVARMRGKCPPSGFDRAMYRKFPLTSTIRAILEGNLFLPDITFSSFEYYCGGYSNLDTLNSLIPITKNWTKIKLAQCPLTDPSNTRLTNNQLQFVSDPADSKRTL
ncbi:MAG: hypothetical protein AB8B55_20165 [Mariniblastus sp.]